MKILKTIVEGIIIACITTYISVALLLILIGSPAAILNAILAAIVLLILTNTETPSKSYV